jgi:hypothetical protein
MNVAMDSGDLLWVFVAAIVAGLGGLFVIGIRIGFSTIIRKARDGYIGWFKDAVDEHVEPKFAQQREEANARDISLRENTEEVARKLEETTISTVEVLSLTTLKISEDVSQKLQKHIEDEEGLMEAGFVKALEPMEEKMDGHIASDAESFSRIENKIDGLKKES